MEERIEQGLVIKADTIEELAEGLGINVEGFVATVERYNEIFDAQVDDDFGKEPFRLSEMRTAPFYGMKMGGIALCRLTASRSRPTVRLSRPTTRQSRACTSSATTRATCQPDLPQLRCRHQRRPQRRAGPPRGQAARCEVRQGALLGSLSVPRTERRRGQVL